MGALYWLSEVFIPLALATYLAFLLNPVVRFLEARGPGRMFAVFSVVAFAAVLLVGTIWLVSSQVSGLLNELPNHTPKIQAKIQALRKLGSGGERYEGMLRDLTQDLDQSHGREGTNPPPKGPGRERVRSQGGPATTSHATTAGWWPWLSEGLTPALGWGAVLALAFVLVIFMLLSREDLRSRFLRLTGQGRMTSTTKAVDDAGVRISRYLLMQLILNVSFGLLVGLGMVVIGVPYAILWGFLAAMLRYVPYVGPIGAAAFPIGASLVLFEAWWPVFAVMAVFLVLDLSMNNLIEPWVFGHSMGVSQVGLIIAAAFWFWLWGPVGLVLSAPLTVVLVVLGKHVPQLEFLDTLLGDQPALATEMNYYQRLLARDADEATQLVLGRLQAGAPEGVYDELLVPALSFTKRDRSRDELTDLDEQFVHQTTREILEDLGERRTITDAPVPAEVSPTALDLRKVYLLGCPAQDEADGLALRMLQQLLDPRTWEVEVTSAGTLTSELTARIVQERRGLICIGSLPPGGLAHTRYLCKRLRAAAPDVVIIVGRWGQKGNLDDNREQLLEAGANHMTTSLIETHRYLDSLHSIHAQKQLGGGSAAVESRAPRETEVAGAIDPTQSRRPGHADPCRGTG